MASSGPPISRSASSPAGGLGRGERGTAGVGQGTTGPAAATVDVGAVPTIAVADRADPVTAVVAGAVSAEAGPGRTVPVGRARAAPAMAARMRRPVTGANRSFSAG
ncbi:hypothetical protein GCM10027605_73390 [Micromonospora zhanjiangensis]